MCGSGERERTENSFHLGEDHTSLPYDVSKLIPLSHSVSRLMVMPCYVHGSRRYNPDWPGAKHINPFLILLYQ